MKAPVWNELNARYISNRNRKIAGIVLHDTAGAGTHNDTLYLVNPGVKPKVSVDFTVERDGSIWKLNPDLSRFKCNHAGRATRFKNRVDAQVNHGTVGIEICQKANLSLSPVYTDVQVKSVAVLCAWLTEEFKLTTADITTHRQIITDGSRSDPRQFPFEGTGGFWNLYWQAKGSGDEFELSEAITKTPDLSAAKLTHVVVKGDTLNSIAKKFYGNPALWTKIQKANSLSGTLILIGQVLIIPPK
ncbi:MAG: N-acetylmuramoyl-L-alanine amidase [Acidobacteriota bacterium]|nr:N-acetylmuramoyl-L-alanine amidase [Acidobacteriota bacterium]